jgi:hypothetical protein
MRLSTLAALVAALAIPAIGFACDEDKAVSASAAQEPTVATAPATATKAQAPATDTKKEAQPAPAKSQPAANRQASMRGLYIM